MTDQERARKLLEGLRAIMTQEARLDLITAEFAAVREECAEIAGKSSCGKDCPYLHYEYDTNASYCKAINGGFCSAEVCEDIALKIRAAGKRETHHDA